MRVRPDMDQRDFDLAESREDEPARFRSWTLPAVVGLAAGLLLTLAVIALLVGAV